MQPQVVFAEAKPGTDYAIRCWRSRITEDVIRAALQAAPDIRPEDARTVVRLMRGSFISGYCAGFRGDVE